MSDEPSALARHLQRRRVLDYEATMSRASYAYGVDVRRMQWLLQSTVAGAFVRDVDRRWPTLAETLEREGVRPVDERAPLWLFEEIARLVARLRCTMPSVRVVADRAAASASWGTATPLGAATGDVQWLVVDPARLESLAPTVRTAALALALGHLHARHAVWFTAFRLAARRDGVDARALPGLPLLARPWTRVMAFTADRAALLCVGALAETRAAIEALASDDAAPARAWLPPQPDLAARGRALEEFDRSVVVARLRASLARERQDDAARASPNAGAGVDATSSTDASSPGAGSPPPPTASRAVPDDAWSLTRVDRKLTERLGLP